jgi:large subunit ribosomal protein L23
MNDPYKIILGPLITEKGTTVRTEKNCYVFKVHPDANKIDIKTAIVKLFNVKVKKVNTATVRGKERQMGRTFGRTSHWKKAYVTLASDQKIQLLEGLV